MLNAMMCFISAMCYMDLIDVILSPVTSMSFSSM